MKLPQLLDTRQLYSGHKAPKEQGSQTPQMSQELLCRH